MRIIELKAENVKRLKAVTIKPDGDMVIIGGNNGEGKTSTLDAIMYALGGKSAIPAEPVRHGEKKAKVTLDLGDYTVTRTMTATGGGTLTVKSKDGGKHGQTKLNEFLGAISLDPLAFTRMSAKEQAESLKELLGVDTSDIEQERKALYEERTLIGRDLKNAKGQLAGLPHHDDVPESVSMAELLEELERVRAHNKSVDELKDAVPYWHQKIEQSRDEVNRLQAALDEARHVMAEQKKRLAEIEEEAEAAEREDEAPIRERLDRAEETAAKIRDNQARASAERRVQELEQDYQHRTEEIESLDERKQALLSSVEMPVDGLTIDDGELRYNGSLFSECSAAEQLRVSVAMACAASPELKVFLIRDGSLLDEKSMSLLAEIAQEYGAQVWVERVGDGDEGAIVIEDGEVR